MATNNEKAKEVFKIIDDAMNIENERKQRIFQLRNKLDNLSHERDMLRTTNVNLLEGNEKLRIAIEKEKSSIQLRKIVDANEGRFQNVVELSERAVKTFKKAEQLDVEQENREDVLVKTVQNLTQACSELEFVAEKNKKVFDEEVSKWRTRLESLVQQHKLDCSKWKEQLKSKESNVKLLQENLKLQREDAALRRGEAALRKMRKVEEHWKKTAVELEKGIEKESFQFEGQLANFVNDTKMLEVAYENEIGQLRKTLDGINDELATTMELDESFQFFESSPRN